MVVVLLQTGIAKKGPGCGAGGPANKSCGYAFGVCTKSGEARSAADVSASARLIELFGFLSR